MSEIDFSGDLEKNLAVGRNILHIAIIVNPTEVGIFDPHGGSVFAKPRVVEIEALHQLQLVSARKGRKHVGKVSANLIKSAGSSQLIERAELS